MEDLYGETVTLVKQGDSPTVDRIRAELALHPAITLEDAPQFYDMEVFNQCVQTQHPLLTARYDLRLFLTCAPEEQRRSPSEEIGVVLDTGFFFEGMRPSDISRISARIRKNRTAAGRNPDCRTVHKRQRPGIRRC